MRAGVVCVDLPVYVLCASVLVHDCLYALRELVCVPQTYQGVKATLGHLGTVFDQIVSLRRGYPGRLQRDVPLGPCIAMPAWGDASPPKRPRGNAGDTLERVLALERAATQAATSLFTPTLAGAGIVLTTYEALHSDINNVEVGGPGDNRGLRTAKRYRSCPSPLPRLLWWRICLDEAQVVENALGAVGHMARTLPAVHRSVLWAACV